MAIEPAATSARPAVTMIAVVATADPDSPAARANGTVNPSDMPITTSRTASLAVKWRSVWGSWCMGFLTDVLGSGMRSRPRESILFTARTAGIALKPVVAIVMPAATPCQDTGRQVRRNEDRPPGLGLPDVGLLMIASQFKAWRIPTEYHMSQRHRVEADTVGEPSGKPAVKLQG